MLTAKKNELAVALTVERINLTSIDYRLEIVEFGNSSLTENGKAHLSPHFHLGSDTDESSISGISYLSTEYINSKDSCYTYIRLGKKKRNQETTY